MTSIVLGLDLLEFELFILNAGHRVTAQHLDEEHPCMDEGKGDHGCPVFN